MSSINQEFVSLIKKNLGCESLNNKKDIKNVHFFIKNSPS